MKKISDGRKAFGMDETGRHEGGRLITREEMEAWDMHSIAEANAAIRAGRMPGPLIDGYTSGPIARTWHL